MLSNIKNIQFQELSCNNKSLISRVIVSFTNGTVFRSNLADGKHGFHLQNWGQLSPEDLTTLEDIVIRAFVREQHPEVQDGYQLDLFATPPAIPH